MNKPQLIGITTDEGGLVCLDCFNNHQTEAQEQNNNINAQESYDIGYPDGYTCASCGDEWYPNEQTNPKEERP